ncbi:hypothetical protein OQA88_7482 [Cercophora sp. LCS_1]
MALPSNQQVQDLVAGLSGAAKGYSNTPDLNGYISRVQIIAQAKELIRTLITPDQLPNYHGLNMAELTSIRTFIEHKVLDAIPTTGSISVPDLSAATGVQASLLERMSRILVHTGFLSSPQKSHLSHTPFSLSYLLDQPSPGHFFLALYDHFHSPMHAFHTHPPTEPSNPLFNPYTTYFNKPGTPVWEIMASNLTVMSNLQKGMTGIDVAIPPVDHFDFSLLAKGEGLQLVDVGGGNGSVLNKILEAHKELDPGRCVVQERKEVVELAKGIVKAGVRVEEGDFTGVQGIKGARAYFMRMILHDYADEVCVGILKNLAEAMNEESMVLVCEMVLGQQVGEADFAGAVMDLAVMTMDGKERTVEGFRGLFEAAGLELVSVWRAEGVPGGVVEGRLKREG